MTLPSDSSAVAERIRSHVTARLTEPGSTLDLHALATSSGTSSSSLTNVLFELRVDRLIDLAPGGVTASYSPRRFAENVRLLGRIVSLLVAAPSLALEPLAATLSRGLVCGESDVADIQTFVATARLATSAAGSRSAAAVERHVLGTVDVLGRDGVADAWGYRLGDSAPGRRSSLAAALRAAGAGDRQHLRRALSDYADRLADELERVTP